MTTKEIIEQVARRHNSTPEKVEEEIRGAIRTAMSTTDPHAQALWRQVAPDGKEPSIEMFLDFCVKRLKAMKGNEL